MTSFRQARMVLKGLCGFGPLVDRMLLSLKGAGPCAVGDCTALAAKLRDIC